MPGVQSQKVRLFYDPTTGERGLQIKLINKTGAASVKGSVLSSSPGTDQGVELCPADAYDPMAICYEAGVADGSEMWCWMPGSMCQMLLEDGTASTRDYWVRDSVTVAGRADATNASPPGGTIVALEAHSKELGHAAESKASGTNVLCLIHFHLN